MDINKAYPSKYLTAADLGDRSPIVTIERVVMESVGQDKKMLPVVYFESKEKGVVCNKTNGKMIATIAGTPETDQWPGVLIQLCSVPIEFGGDLVDAIRVRKPSNTRPTAARLAPMPPPAPVPELTDDDIPF